MYLRMGSGTGLSNYGMGNAHFLGGHKNAH